MGSKPNFITSIRLGEPNSKTEYSVSRYWSNLPKGIKPFFLKSYHVFGLMEGVHDPEIEAFLENLIEEAFADEI